MRQRRANPAGVSQCRAEPRRGAVHFSRAGGRRAADPGRFELLIYAGSSVAPGVRTSSLSPSAGSDSRRLSGPSMTRKSLRRRRPHAGSRVPGPGCSSFPAAGRRRARTRGAPRARSRSPRAPPPPGPGRAAGLLALAAVAQRRRPTGSFTICCVTNNFKRCVLCLITASATIANERIVQDFLCHKYLFVAPA